MIPAGMKNRCVNNAGNVEAYIGGCCLTEDITQPEKWRIPAGTTIPAGGYLVYGSTVITENRGCRTAVKVYFS